MEESTGLMTDVFLKYLNQPSLQNAPFLYYSYTSSVNTGGHYFIQVISANKEKDSIQSTWNGKVFASLNLN